MSESLLTNALQLTVHLSWPVIGFVLLAAIIAGIFRVVTQIDDASISFAVKLFAVFLFFVVASSYVTTEIVDFSAQVWARPDFYK